jgi:oligopeptide transport system substrate-binding protein
VGRSSSINFKQILTIAAIVLSILAVIIAGFFGLRILLKADTDGSDGIFSYDLPANPATLDPQTATAEHERSVIANLFEGLLRMDAQGDIIAGVALEYDISDCQTVYTFYLRSDVYWIDRNDFQARCTAHDFVFAFRRLFNPEVRSLNAPDYFSILNSQKAADGELPPESIGVTAKDDFTLIIELEHPDADFTVLLTAPPAFPCNEEFYIHAAGRYGRTADAVPSNGGFFLREWVYDPHWTYENRIILRRHEKNNDSERVYPRGVDFRMDRGEPLDNFINGIKNCIVISGDGVDSLIKSGHSYTGAENSVWGITFNKERVFADDNLRKALAYATDRDSIEMDKTGYRKTTSIVPDSIKIGSESYRDIVLNKDFGEISADSAKAAQYFNKSAELIQSNPVLIVPIISGDESIADFVRFAAQQWQEKLSLFCRIDVVDLNEYTRRLNDGDYDIAVVRITAAYNSPSAVLSQLTETESAAGTAEQVAQFYLQAEKKILQSADFIPLCFMTEYFFNGRNIEDLVYNPFTGTIVFRNAKMF